MTEIAFISGVVSSMFALGPFTANMLAALTLRLPENIIADGKSQIPLR